MATEESCKKTMPGYEGQHTICPYCILGIRSGSSREEVDFAYQRLISTLDEENFMSAPQSWVQAQQSCIAIENAYSRIIEGEEDAWASQCLDLPGSAIPPKLGQMLVAAGLITLEQLELAIAEQTTVDLPLGEILKKSSLLTQMELDTFLLNQHAIKLPPDSPYLIGQRLIGLGLITEDMLRIALMEQRTMARPLGQILVERCWLAGDILEALLVSARSEDSAVKAN